jgi:hypothetical protein
MHVHTLQCTRVAASPECAWIHSDRISGMAKPYGCATVSLINFKIQALCLPCAAREVDNATILKGFPGEASPSESFNALPGNKVDLSPDGKQFAVLTIKSIKIYDCETEEQVH